GGTGPDAAGPRPDRDDPPGAPGTPRGPSTLPGAPSAADDGTGAVRRLEVPDHPVARWRPRGSNIGSGHPHRAPRPLRGAAPPNTSSCSSSTSRITTGTTGGRSPPTAGPSAAPGAAPTSPC